EARAYIAVGAVGREDRHPRPIADNDALCFGVAAPVKHGDIVFASDCDPYLLAVRREERLVRRATYIGDMLHGVGGGVDKADRIRSDRYRSERAMIGREPQSMHQNLTAIERTEIPGLRIAETDLSQERVGGRVDHRNGVRELLGCVNAIASTDRNIRVRGGRRSLPR